MESGKYGFTASDIAWLAISDNILFHFYNLGIPISQRHVFYVFQLNVFRKKNYAILSKIIIKQFIYLTPPLCGSYFFSSGISLTQIDLSVASETHSCVSWSKAAGWSGTILMNMKGGFVGSGQGIMRRLTCIQRWRQESPPFLRNGLFFLFVLHISIC